MNRYLDDWTRLRAMNHALASGIVTAFALKHTKYGLFASLSGVPIEIYQMFTDKNYDAIDGVYDALEWLVGGLLIGLVFYVD